MTYEIQGQPLATDHGHGGARRKASGSSFATPHIHVASRAARDEIDDALP